MLKACPNPVDVQDIQFKSHCRLKVFDNKDLGVFPNRHSLISCASRYGLLFIGSNSPNFQVLLLKSVESYSMKDKDISNYPRRTIHLPSVAKHVCVNCDSTILAVVVEKDKCSTVIFYDVLSFYKQNVVIIKELRLSATPEVIVSEVAWNPALPPIFTACKSDGTLGVYEIKGSSVDINELPPAAQTSSFCWSPKGKQIAVGSKNGKITQYKPDLKAVKVISEPPLQKSHSLISLQWVSNYQFVGIYQAEEAGGQAKLIVVDAPKTGNTSYIDYDDICYSGSSRVPQFYMLLQQHWNILMVSSSNSMEVGVLGTSTPETWIQWIISDSARAELPLSADKQETFPVGLALDISPTNPLPWGEGTIPPCPYLLILSHQGVLCFFNVVNLKPGAPSICCPPENVADTSGLVQFENEAANVTGEVKGSQALPQQPPATFAFGSSQSDAAKTTPALPTAFSVPSTKPPLSFPSQPLSQPQVPAASAAKSLFGGQTSLTPVKPQQPVASQQPVTAPLFGGQISLTPAQPKQAVASPATLPSSQPGTAPTTKYSSIFSALSAPAAIPPPNQSKPVVATVAAAQAGQQSVDARAIIDEKVKGETDALLAKMVRDECLALDSEVKALLHQGRRVNIDIGSDEEKVEMLRELEGLREFIKEIVDISLGENAEVHSLKQNLILSWAWYEEAQSRYNTSKDETMTLLLKSQPLDSATEKRRSDIQKLIYYMESQLLQTNNALDEQWERFQDYAKKTHRVQMPTMEAIFQSMVKQNAVLQKQSYILKDIANRIKHKKTAINGPPLILSIGHASKLEDDLKRLQMEPEDPQQAIYETTINKTRNLTSKKQSKLRNLLKSRNIMHIVKPQLNASFLSPRTRGKQTHSILGAQMSPVQKMSVARNLEFVQSTPIRDVKTDTKPTVAPPNTPAQTETPKMFTFKNTERNIFTTAINNPNLVPANTSILSNPSQSTSQTSVSSLSSAFAPTAQASKTSVVPKTSEKPVTSTFSAPSFSFGNTNSGVAPNKTAVATSKSQPVISIKSGAPQLNFGSGLTVTPVSSKQPEPTPAVTPTCTSSTKSLFSFTGASNDAFKTATASTSSFLGSITSKPLFGSASTALFGTATTTTVAQSNTNSTLPTTITTTSNISSTASTASPLNLGIAFSSSNKVSHSTSLKPGVSVGAVTPSVTSKPSTTSAIVSATVPLQSATPTSTAIISTFSFASTSVPGSVTSSTKMPTSFFGSAVTTGPSIFGVGSTVTAGNSIATSTTTAIEVSSTSTPSVVPKGTTPDLVTTSTISISPSIFSMLSAGTAPAVATSATTTANPLSSHGNPLSTPSIPSSTPSNPSSTLGNLLSTPVNPTSIPGNPSSTLSTGISSIAGSNPASSSSATATGTFAVSTPAAIITTATSTAAASGSSIFASVPGTTVTIASPTVSSIFGSTPAIPTTALSFGSALFGASTATTASGSIFGSSTASTSVTSSTAQSPSIFGSGSTTSAFGAIAASTTQAPVFGGIMQGSIFGSSTANTSKSSVFGGSAPVPSGSIFGGGGTTSQAPIFGVSTFGTAVAPTAAQSSIFGAAATTVFGSTTTTATVTFDSIPAVTSTSPFSATLGQSSGSLFGTPATSTAASAFGGFGGSSVFGATPATTGFSQPAFGASANPAFGTSTTSASASTFGTVSSSSNVFGAPAVSSSSGNVFGTPAVSSSSFSFATGNTAAGANSFGFGSLNVGSAATSTTGSIFGQTPNLFAGAAEQKSGFGGSGSIFGAPTSTTASPFGTNTGSTFGSAGQSAFGATTFGSPGATFGQQSAFGQSSFGSSPTFSGAQPGPFSGTGGATNVGQSGFGSPSSFQKPAGFGGAPVFGGSPQVAFGASPSFGGAPAFGAAPAFGSPDKVFGSSTPTATFGSPATSSPGFGNLANQNTVGFGNLAQQANNTPTTTAFSGYTSFSSWR